MKQDAIKNTIIENVSEYAGSAAGAVAGGLIGAAICGPEGAAAESVAATAIEHMFQNMGSEIKKRALAPLEEERVGTVYAKAKELIEEKIAQGKTLRNDNFFDKDNTSRPASEELLEGTLLAAQREHEEKKTVYLARLYANILFHPEISRPTANHPIKLAEQLTYRQIAILNNIAAMQFARALNPPINPLKKSAYGSVSGTENVAIAAEIFDLYRMSILGSSQVILDAGGINPSTLTVFGYGAHLYNLMDLGSMEPDPELIEIQASIMLFLIGAKQRQQSDGRSRKNLEQLRDIGKPKAHSGDTEKTATNATPIQHEGSMSPRFDSKHPGHTKRSEPSSPKGERAMPNDDIPYLLKFAPIEGCIDNPMDGCLHTNAADRHHNLPNEQGDPLEASLSYGMGI